MNIDSGAKQHENLSNLCGDLLSDAVSASDKADNDRSLIQVDSAKIDALITMVGELMTANDNLRILSGRLRDAELSDTANTIIHLVTEIRELTMNIRMAQLGETFESFRQPVAELSRKLGKEMNLSIEGGETELDKAIIAKLTDSIWHLVKNAAEHGIESAEERIIAKKRKNGTIALIASQENGSVVIEIRDDGRGMSREGILKTAVERGLLPEGMQIEDSEVFKMLSRPGFVAIKPPAEGSDCRNGMDTVLRNIESLRGTLDIESEFGNGTVIRIQLPLTLSITDGFHVKVGGASYVLPLAMVIECVDVRQGDLQSEGGDIYTLRGETIPYLCLSEFFGTASHFDASSARSMVVVEYARKRIGLIVDSLSGNLQAAVKPLGRLFSQLDWISGAAIIGNGDIALIIDVPRLVDKVKNNVHRKERTA